jgi:hypothetical protein
LGNWGTGEVVADEPGSQVLKRYRTSLFRMARRRGDSIAVGSCYVLAARTIHTGPRANVIGWPAVVVKAVPWIPLVTQFSGCRRGR